TAEAAVDALVNAAKSVDQKGILTVLGPDGAGIAASGDKVEDAAARKRFHRRLRPQASDQHGGRSEGRPNDRRSGLAVPNSDRPQRRHLAFRYRRRPR